MLQYICYRLKVQKHARLSSYFFLSHRKIFTDFCLQSVKIMHYSFLHLNFFIFITRCFEGP